MASVPPTLTKTLNDVDKSLKALNLVLKEDIVKDFKDQSQELISTLNSVSNAFDKHIGEAIKCDPEGKYEHAYKEIERKVSLQNQALIESLKRNLEHKIEIYKLKTKNENAETSALTFRSPFAEAKEDDQSIPKSKSLFSTSDTISDLERHNEKIKSIEEKVELLQNQLKADPKAIEADELISLIQDNHKRLLQFQTDQARYESKKKLKITKRNPKGPKEKMPKKEHVTSSQFTDFTNRLTDNYDMFTNQIASFKQVSEHRLQIISDRIDSTDNRITQFEQRINTINNLMESINDKIDDIDDFQEDNKGAKPIFAQQDEMNFIVQSFQNEMKDVKSKTREEIASIRKMLDDLQRSIEVV